MGSLHDAQFPFASHFSLGSCSTMSFGRIKINPLIIAKCIPFELCLLSDSNLLAGSWAVVAYPLVVGSR